MCHAFRWSMWYTPDRGAAIPWRSFNWIRSCTPKLVALCPRAADRRGVRQSVPRKTTSGKGGTRRRPASRSHRRLPRRGVCRDGCCGDFAYRDSEPRQRPDGVGRTVPPRHARRRQAIPRASARKPPVRRPDRAAYPQLGFLLGLEKLMLAMIDRPEEGTSAIRQRQTVGYASGRRDLPSGAQFIWNWRRDGIGELDQQGHVCRSPRSPLRTGTSRIISDGLEHCRCCTFAATSRQACRPLHSPAPTPLTLTRRRIGGRPSRFRAANVSEGKPVQCSSWRKTSGRMEGCNNAVIGRTGQGIHSQHRLPGSTRFRGRCVHHHGTGVRHPTRSRLCLKDRKACCQAIEEGKHGGRFILSAGREVPRDTPPENLRDDRCSQDLWLYNG